jgi:hypothetical protein
MISRNGCVWLAGFFVSGLVGAAVAQSPVSDAQNKLLAKRAAEADAYRKLAETVYGVQLNSETYVRDFVTESDVIRTGIDTFIKGIRLGQPRYYDDGVCEVDAEVTVEKLVTTIKTLHSQHYHGNRITTTDIENIKNTIKSDVITATGTGAPRPELPPDLPMGIEEIITPLPADYKPALTVPAIWKTVGGQGRLMAQRAARLDAMRKLLEQIKGLRLTSDTLVRDFVTESDEIRTQAEGIVVGAIEAGTYLHDDELIAEVTMEVPVEKVITTIKELHSKHYQGNRITTTDIENVKKTIQRDIISATGCGVPPERFLSQAKSAGFDMPPWMGERVRALGEGTDPAMDSAQGKLKAARAARLDALRKLAEQIHGLQINSSTTVRDFVTERDEIASRVQAIIAGAVEESTEFTPDGVARVTMSVAAADVWGVIHGQMGIDRRHGG